MHSREDLLERVWGGSVYVQARTVDVHIRRLRKALSVDGHQRFIQTVRGAGYRFPISMWRDFIEPGAFARARSPCLKI